MDIGSIRQQYMGVHQLMELCKEVGLIGDEEEARPSIHHTFGNERDH